MQVGDILVEYGGVKIASRSELRSQIKAAREAGLEEIPLLLKRGEETLTMKFKPGPVGIGGVVLSPIFAVLAMVADQVGRSRRLLEEVLYHQRRRAYDEAAMRSADPDEVTAAADSRVEWSE